MRYLLLFIEVISILSCKPKPEMDAIYYNAKIYTVNSKGTIADAMVVNKGKIVYVGSKDSAFSLYSSANKINLGGKFVYPGFIDAHCHFFSYGTFISKLDLGGTTSWPDVIDKTKQFAATHPDGWLLGREWDQNKWEQEKTEFPTNKELNELFPDRPVFLERVDGHACVVNKKALELAHITVNTKIPGGKIVVENGELTGVLLDNAKDSVAKYIPFPSETEVKVALISAQANCFAVGLTTVDDAGLPKIMIDVIDSLQKDGMLKMRIYAMLSDNDENRAYYFKHGIYKTDRLNVRSFKFFSDGALGSRGALLMQPYSDSPNESGLQLKPTEYFRQQAELCYEHGFQMCTHAIGDSANRMMLQIYASVLKGPNDRRWRIEHCQVVFPDDIHYFGDYNIIPSIQTTHATSDMYWAGARLGPERVKSAYAYLSLLKQNGWLANGTDFPVEHINPLYSFYAAVARKDQKSYPTGGFQPENALTREQALQAMTIWAAKSNFEENEKGSLEPGKLADFVVLENDIMTIPIEETFSVKILKTYINGENVYDCTNLK